MASTLFVHSDDQTQRLAFYEAVKASNPGSYFCDILRMIALAYTTGLMAGPGSSPAPPPGPGPHPPPPPPPPLNITYACNAAARTCQVSARSTCRLRCKRSCLPWPASQEGEHGLYPSLPQCQQECQATTTNYTCFVKDQTCAPDASGNFSSLGTCTDACKEGSCPNRPYGQCGGTNWHGPTCCPDGYQCTGSGYYYGCTPASTSTVQQGSSRRNVRQDAPIIMEA